MKNIVKFAVSNPVTICMVVLAILLLGKISYDQLSVDLLPDLNNPRLFIELKAGERPPEEIEKQFVKNMESMAIRQSDVTQVSSVVKAGSARITVEYTWTKDMDEAFLDLQKAMNPFAQNKDITELKITQHDPNQSPEYNRYGGAPESGGKLYSQRTDPVGRRCRGNVVGTGGEYPDNPHRSL